MCVSIMESCEKTDGDESCVNTYFHWFGDRESVQKVQEFMTAYELGKQNYEQ